jgi:TonB-dependent starch-binding outer membrane protein SusC
MARPTLTLGAARTLLPTRAIALTKASRLVGRGGLMRGTLLAAVLAGSAAGGAQQPSRQLTGRVTDQDTRAPIPDVSVVVTATTVKTVSTHSGAFSLRFPADARTLSVQRIGYLAATVSVAADQTDVTVVLVRDILRLEQQVITGLATTIASRNAANDVAILDAQAIDQVPTPTVENAMQGKVLGAVIQENNGGAPGGGIQVQIRGVTSINSDGAPLYVIDGIMLDNETINSGLSAVTQAGGIGPSPQDLSPNRVADLNPEDIESVQVLKGASASAIYGSKASAGVIIITTKKGGAGTPRWQLSQKVGHFSAANSLPLRRFPTLASAVDWGDSLGFPKSVIDASYAGPQDFQSQLFGNPQASYETDISGGGTINQTQFFASALSKYDNGTLLNTGYNKQAARVNMTQQFTGALSANLNLMYAHSATRRGVTGNDNIGISPMNVFTYTPQFVDLNRRDASGAWVVNPFGPANPFADANDIQTPEGVSRFLGGGSFDWQPYATERQSLTVRFNGGVDFTAQRDQLYAPPGLQVERFIPGGPGTATLQDDQTSFLNYSINLVHHYGASSSLDATTSLGFVRERRTNNAPDVVAQNLIAGVNTPTAGTVVTVIYNRDEVRDQSFYGQEQMLLFGSRLALTGGLTGERSTVDGEIDRFYLYPRASLAYRIPRLVGFIDELKLRTAYGQSGTQPGYGVKYTPFVQTLDGGQTGVSPNSLHGDSLVRPERETELEVGFDAAMMKSRAQLSVTLYQKRVSDLLLQASVAPSRHFNQEWINGGVFTNQGIEISLDATPIRTRGGLTWSAGVTYYRNYSVVNSIPVAPFADGISTFGNAYIIPGRSVSELIDLTRPGADSPYVQVGDFQPSFVMSLSQSLSYKRFRLSGLLDYHRGGTLINITEWLFDFGSHLLADTAASRQRAAASLTGDIRPYLEAGTFVKLRELAASLTLPDRWTQWLDQRAGIRFTNVRLSLTARNLLTWSAYRGLDPEVSFFGSQNVTRGQDVTPYPPSRSVFASLDLGF